MSERQPERPAAMVAWEHEDAERSQRQAEQYPRAAMVPEAVRTARAEEMRGSFAVAWQTLSAAERAAEFAHLNALLRDDPAGSHSTVSLRNSLITATNAHEMRLRGEVELEGCVAAQNALGRCRYLGGFTGYPNPADTWTFVCGVGATGELQWLDRRHDYVAVAAWPDVREMRVGPSDRGADRVTASRAATFGVFALGARKQRREAMLAVKTATGEGIFIVHGRTPLELQAALAPLVSRIGETTSDEFVPSAMSAGIDKDLLENARRESEAELMEVMRFAASQRRAAP